MREQIRSGVLPRRVRTGCRRSLWLAAPVQRDRRVMAQHSKRCVPALSRDVQHRWSSRSPVGRSVRAYTALTPYLRRVRHLRAAVSVCGAVSRIANVAPFSSASFRICDNRSECVEITAGVSPSRLSRHFAAEDCGSRSIKAVRVSGTFRGDGQMRGEGCLACPAFPAQDCECFHFYLRLCKVASVHTLPMQVCCCADVMFCTWK